MATNPKEAALRMLRSHPVLAQFSHDVGVIRSRIAVSWNLSWLGFAGSRPALISALAREIDLAGLEGPGKSAYS